MCIMDTYVTQTCRLFGSHQYLFVGLDTVGAQKRNVFGIRRVDGIQFVTPTIQNQNIQNVGTEQKI